MKASLKRKATPAPVASLKAAPQPAKPPQGTWWWGAPDEETKTHVAAPNPTQPAPARMNAAVLAELARIASPPK